MDFHTASNRNGLIGLGLVAVLLAGLGVLIQLLAAWPFTLSAFGIGVGILILLAALVALAYWSVSTLRLSYHLDRNGVRIRWGASHTIVPIGNIQTIVPLDRAPAELGLRDLFRRRAWLGGWAAPARLGDGRMAVLRGNGDPSAALAIFTETHAYLISPERPTDFVAGWRERRFLGTTQAWREEDRRASWLRSPFWSDHITWGLMGGVVVTALVLFGTLALVYERLPERLPLHFDVFGQPDRIGQRTEVLRLPVVALLFLVIDLGLGFLVYRRDRVAAYLIWAGAILLQLLAWGALYGIATR